MKHYFKLDLLSDGIIGMTTFTNMTIDDLKQWVLDKVMDIEPEEKVNNKMGFSK